MRGEDFHFRQVQELVGCGIGGFDLHGLGIRQRRDKIHDKLRAARLNREHLL